MFKQSLVEFLGTFFLVLTLAASGNPVAIALVYIVMVYVGAHVSGGQYNPALTIGLLSVGKLKAKKAFGYIVAQFLGGCVAIGVFMFLGGKEVGISPASGASFLQATVAELIFSFLFVLTVFFTMVHKKAAGNSYYGLAIGFSYLLGALVIGPVSGGALNPVLGVVPQLFKLLMGNGIVLENIALYIIAPVIGGIGAAQFFEFVVEHADK